jgi:threonine synthase
MTGLRYLSTRGQAPALDFAETVIAGLAPDGGLYVPESFPQFSAAEWRSLRGLPYAKVAEAVIGPFTGGLVAPQTLAHILEEAYGTFAHQAVVPLRQLDSNLWLMELFHGPTLAFKDVALQFLGRLLDHLLGQRGTRATVIGATSGDTGSAAIEACRDRAAIEIFILHPHNRTSAVQRRQMTTVTAPNVFNIALDGTFDDCQDAVKAMFADAPLREALNFSAVNSINWARIVAQTVYYVTSALALGAPERKVSFAVPTGNFGNVYAAYVAKRMGLPIETLVIGSNRNDILTRFFTSGAMETEAVVPTLSPSMDIQISSNFERYLFELFGRDAKRLAQAMQDFRTTGKLAVMGNELAAAREIFFAARCDDEHTSRRIREMHADTGITVDPHTAVGLSAALDYALAQPEKQATPLVSLACAHPAKFPAAVEQAVGEHPALPPRLADLFEREERLAVLPNDLARVKQYVSEKVAERRAAHGRSAA